MISLQVLGAEGVQQIHAATLRVLSEVGVILTHPGARELLVSHGAHIAGDRALLPADLGRSIALPNVPTPSRCKAATRPSQLSWAMAPVTFSNVGGVPNIADSNDGTRRPALRNDNAKTARLLDDYRTCPA